jgi:hypothetical protein
VVVTALDGSSITANLPAGLASDWFSGGYIEFDRNGYTERRGLRSQDGNTLHLFGGTTGLQVGQSVTLYPGCDRTIATCDSKFPTISTTVASRICRASRRIPLSNCFRRCGSV